MPLAPLHAIVFIIFQLSRQAVKERQVDALERPVIDVRREQPGFVLPEEGIVQAAWRPRCILRSTSTVTSRCGWDCGLPCAGGARLAWRCVTMP